MGGEEADADVALSASEVERADAYRNRRDTAMLCIMFTDLAGSTALRERMGEAAYQVLQDQHDETIRSVVEAGDKGLVVKMMGDGTLSVFAEPATAVLCSLDVQRAFRSTDSLNVRIGLDMGQVTRRRDEPILRDVFGGQVNRAARVQHLAEPRHVLATFPVYDLAVGWLHDRSVSWREHGLTTLRGFERDVSLFEPFLADVAGPQASVGIASGGSECPACLHPNSPDANFCSACGHRLPQAASCPICGQPVGVDSKFCGQCGSPLGRAREARRADDDDERTVGQPRVSQPMPASAPVPPPMPASTPAPPPPARGRFSLPWSWRSRKPADDLNYGTLILPSRDSLIPPRSLEVYLERIRRASSRSTKPTILWVDDYPQNNTFLAALLGAAGCHIDLAHDTQEAKSRLASPYLLVITDMGRAESATAGIDLLRWMRDARLRTPAVVFTSVDSALANGQEARTLGAIECTAGAVSLVRAICEVVEGHRSAA